MPQISTSGAAFIGMISVTRKRRLDLEETAEGAEQEQRGRPAGRIADATERAERLSGRDQQQVTPWNHLRVIGDPALRVFVINCLP
jgi:hypothetical protein